MVRIPLRPSLPPVVGRVFIGIAISSLGNGLILPFLMVYLHEVRGIRLQTAALVMTTIAAVGIVSTFVGGMLVDRFGAKRMLLIAQLILATGYAGLALASTPAQAFIVAVIIGAGQFTWSSLSSLLAVLVPAERRPAMFGMQFMLVNAGIGIGGIAGGLLAHVTEPLTFQLLYLADATTFLCYFVVLSTLPRLPATGRADRGSLANWGGYREVFADRRFLVVWALGVVLVMFGYAQLDAGFPPFARLYSGISTQTLGFAFAVNTICIIAIQPWAIGWVTRHRRSRALMLVATSWVVAFAVLGLSALLPGAMGSVAAIAFAGLFGVGEALLSPTGSSLINDLASDELRGRYNAAYSQVFAVANILGPALAGAMLDRGWAAAWIILVMSGLAVLALCWLRLGKRLGAADYSHRAPSPEPVAV